MCSQASVFCLNAHSKGSQQQDVCWNSEEMFLQQVHLLLDTVSAGHHLPALNARLLRI